jgi:cobalt-zinc-cadmium efflux system membrane fusion protein
MKDSIVEESGKPMKPIRIAGITLLVAGLITAFAAFTSTGCAKAHSQPTERASAPARDPSAVAADDTLQRRLKVGEVPLETVNEAMDAPGRVETNEQRMARVNASLSGRIISVQAVEGDSVKRGQVLATYFSTELAEQQNALLKANVQKSLAERAVTRGQQLLAADVIGAAEVQRREADLQQAAADAASARDQLLALGMPEEDLAAVERTRTVNSVARIVASMDGTVVERRITIGQVLQVGETAFTISDLSSLWLVADVPEEISAGVKSGKLVRAEVNALPGQIISGTLTYVSAVVNPETRTVRARMDLPNPQGAYKPAMLATMMISNPAHKQKILPLTATVREENKEYCFVETSAGHYSLHEVQLGGEAGDGRILVSGVSPRERIVLDGAFHLNNERKRLLLQGGD